MKFPDDLTDEQLVAWDRDAVPYLPAQPCAIIMTHINDIDVHYAKDPEVNLTYLSNEHLPSLYGNTFRDFFRWYPEDEHWRCLLAGSQQWTWLPGHTVSPLRQVPRSSESQ